MAENDTAVSLVACCGLYCGACGAYKKGKCPGCPENEKADWCKVRACCIDHGYTTCADCTEVADFRDCTLLNSFIARMFKVIFRSNRPASLDYIREHGRESYAAEMERQQAMTVRVK